MRYHLFLFLIAISTPITYAQSVGGQQDAHGCLTGAGYTWCESLGKCVRPWEEQCPPASIGGEKDAHGCLIGAGETWCATLGKCIRAWEEPCPEQDDAPVYDGCQQSTT